jgi:hypothetical protein
MFYFLAIGKEENALKKMYKGNKKKNLKKNKIITYRSSINIRDKFQQCTEDIASLFVMRKYCGLVIDRLLPFQAELTLQDDGKYSDTNIYCKWRGINRVPLSKIYLNLTIFDYQNSNIKTITDIETEEDKKLKEKYLIEVFYFDGSKKVYEINTNSFYINSSFINYIILHFYSPRKLNNLPFIADFAIVEQNNLTTNYMSIFIIIGLVILGCVFLSIFIQRCKRFIQREEQQPNSIAIREMGAQRVNDIFSERDEYQDRIFRREEIKRIRNQEALNKIFKDQTKIEKFNKKAEQDFCSNCTICMEDFLPDSDVLTLTCRHAFHPNCLKNWLSIILLNPKCPNCNNKILDYESEESDEDEEDNTHYNNNNISIRIRGSNNNYLNRSQINLPRNNSRLANDRSINNDRNEGLNRSHNNPRSNNRLQNSIRSNNNNNNNRRRDDNFSMLSNISIENNDDIQDNEQVIVNRRNNRLSSIIEVDGNATGFSRNNYVLRQNDNENNISNNNFNNSNTNQRI